MAELTQDEHWMTQAIELARQAKAAGESAVGAILVRNNEVLGQSREYVRQLNDPSAHAEVLAIRIACAKGRTCDLSDATLYTTTEPCPLCSYVIRETGIARVVIGARYDVLGGISSGYPLLLDESIADWGAAPEITRDFMHDACEALHNS